ncbi:MAG: molybdate ABC transporter substrate-binding protein [Desulfuromonadales bacterium]|nr:molybdate ABC transporter substrate-binding protein [Desulfuromonadales bacterium]
MRTLLLSLLFLLPSPSLADEVHLAAAASLRELVMVVASRFEATYPEHRLRVNTASSGTLARQVVAGAPVDLFISANPEWMMHLVEEGKISPGSPRPWAANRLVVVGRGQPLDSLADLKSLRRLAIGSPESVPAGRYARIMLEKAGLYHDLEKRHRLVFAKDVRQALLYAEQGVVDVAIVYRSDVRLLRQTRVVLTPAADLQPEIRYPIALTNTGEQKPAARELCRLLTGPAGATLMESNGLTPLGGEE